MRHGMASALFWEDWSRWLTVGAETKRLFSIRKEN